METKTYWQQMDHAMEEVLAASKVLKRVQKKLKHFKGELESGKSYWVRREETPRVRPV
jgi:hypothetical protein